MNSGTEAMTMRIKYKTHFGIDISFSPRLISFHLRFLAQG
jgi:hypothetical protein